VHLCLAATALLVFYTPPVKTQKWRGRKGKLNMKIAILAHLYHPIRQPYLGGLEMHTHMLADELADRGHDVTLIAKAGSECKGKVIPVLSKSFNIQAHKSKAMQELQQLQLRFAERLSIAAAKSSKFDCIINNSLSALPYTQLSHIPMLTMLHTPLDLPRIKKTLRSKWLASPMHMYASVSEINARTWQHYLPHIKIIPNGIRLQDWKSDVAAVAGRAVWVARITPEKGLHIAIEAVKKAGMKLDFAGPISNKTYFQEKIVPQLDDRIRYRGHLDHGQLADFLASGEVFVASPLWEEPFGLSVVEALASGTPVAATPRGAMTEIVTSKVGATAENSESDALGRAILQARTAKREDCRRYAQRYSLTTMVDEYERVLRQLRVGLLSQSASVPAFGKLQSSL